MFNSMKHSIASLYGTLRTSLRGLFSGKKVDEVLLQDIEKSLLQADVGVAVTRSLLKVLRSQSSVLTTPVDIKEVLRKELYNYVQAANVQADIYLVVGINGAGKTTNVAKLAYAFKKAGKNPLVVAADTFRAAAVQQLEIWSQSYNLPLVKGEEQQDPGAVVFSACAIFKEGDYDSLFIDTAGRLHTKTHLMQELEKIKRIITKQLPGKKIATVLLVDATLGQTSLEQAKLFHEKINIDGVILSKIDSSAKGGIILSLYHTLHIPVWYLSYGESIDSCAPFSAQTFISSLLDEDI